MKKLLIPSFAALVLSSAAIAQTSPSPAPAPAAPAPAAPATPAPTVTEPSTTGTTAPRQDANAPLPGANSFTEAQAKSRIEQNGFSGVTSLRKDDQGIWRAMAMKDGKSVTVSLDYRGNIVTQ